MVPEEKIKQALDYLVNSSNEGDVMQCMITVYSPMSGVGPLGIPDATKLETAVYALAPVAPVDALAWTQQQIRQAGFRHRLNGEQVLFAAISQEMYEVAAEDFDDEARRLRAAGRLQDHPRVTEVSLVYGACADGRRWRTHRHLTGPERGASPVELLEGGFRPNEERGRVERLVCQLVGLEV